MFRLNLETSLVVGLSFPDDKIYILWERFKLKLSLLYIGDKKMTDEFRCTTKYCTKEPAVKLLGKWLCDYCWSKHCEEEQNGVA